MNGYTLASSYNGCIGEYPISQILNIDSNINTSIYSGNEICFSNLNYFNTKIDNQGILRFFHNQTEFLPTVLSQWISVPDAIVYLLQEDIQWNAQSIDNTAAFSLINAELSSTTITANAGYALATSANGTAITALGASTTNGVQIASINNTLPTLISSNVLQNVLTPYFSSNAVLNNFLLKTDHINLNQINGWISTTYGTYYDITNGTLAISATPTQMDFLIVGGQTTIQGELVAEKRIKENNQYLSNVYISSNILQVQNYINSNSISSIVGFYLPLKGGTMSGSVSGITTLNATTGIFSTISTTTNGNQAIPSVGNFGGIGDKIILYTGSSTTYPYSIGIETNSLWLSSPIDIKFYNNGSNAITISSTYELIAKNRIKENNLYLSDVYISSNVLQSQNYINSNSITNVLSPYLSSNHLYIIQDAFTSERQYPSKLYNSASGETTTTFLGKTVYTQNFTLDTTGITYGSGIYTIYSSTTYGSILKNLLFDYDLNNSAGAGFQGGQYNSPAGTYAGANFIVSGYTGDWIILKFPTNSVILTKFVFKERVTLNSRAPAEWKLYGSNDGINFVEITQGSSTSRLTSSDYVNGFYTKTFSNSTAYQYIGFTINKVIGGINSDMVNISEIQLFGKEPTTPSINPIYVSSNILQIQNYINSNSITNVLSPYISSNTLQNQNYINSNSITNVLTNYSSSNAVQNIVMNMSSVSKHTGFYITVSTAIGINSITYYKYDIDLRPYTSLGVIQIGPSSGDTYRNFNISLYYANCYYSVLTNNILDVSDYKIFMSYKAVGSSPGIAGLNFASISSSAFFNPNLDKIPPNNLFLMRNGGQDINYITVVSKQPADVRVLISDLIG